MLFRSEMDNGITGNDTPWVDQIAAHLKTLGIDLQYDKNPDNSFKEKTIRITVPAAPTATPPVA